jgi:hypothetical protein
MPVIGGPYLSSAFFCERVLREQDQVLSFVRVVDRWTLTGATDKMLPHQIETTMVLVWKSGIHRGSSQVAITPTTPSGKVLPPIEVPVVFEGDDDRGTGAILPLAFPVEESGCYWFDVALDGQSITQVPMRINYLRVARPPSPNQAST